VGLSQECKLDLFNSPNYHNKEEKSNNNLNRCLKFIWRNLIHIHILKNPPKSGNQRELPQSEINTSVENIHHT
jgi:hypothetical protein